jgi:hypothetical protein
MRLCALFVNRFRMVERSRFQTFAARLLPEPAGRAGVHGGARKTTEAAEAALNPRTGRRRPGRPSRRRPAARPRCRERLALHNSEPRGEPETRGLASATAMPRRPGGRTLSAPRPRRTEHARFHEKQRRAGRGYRVLPIVRSGRLAHGARALALVTSSRVARRGSQAYLRVARGDRRSAG